MGYQRKPTSLAFQQQSCYHTPPNLLRLTSHHRTIRPFNAVFIDPIAHPHTQTHSYSNAHKYSSILLSHTKFRHPQTPYMSIYIPYHASINSVLLLSFLAWQNILPCLEPTGLLLLVKAFFFPVINASDER